MQASSCSCGSVALAALWGPDGSGGRRARRAPRVDDVTPASLWEASVRWGRSFSCRAMIALPDPDYENHPKYRQFLSDVTDDLRIEALNSFLPRFQKNYRRHLTSPAIDYEVKIGAGGDILQQLQQDGCAAFAVSDARKANLFTQVAPIAERVHTRNEALPRPRFKDSQVQLDRTDHQDIFRQVHELLESEKIYSVGSAYAGRKISLKTLAVQVNTQRATTLTYGELDEFGRPRPRTRYLHIDSAFWPPLKVLVYLNPVGPDQGPFRYVVGSHRLASDYELVVRKTNDKAGIHNATFMALPRPFRMYTEFGDAMDPDSDQADRLLEKERTYGDGVADLILFDFNGVHRGGFVRSGWRYMLQCCFSAAD